MQVKNRVLCIDDDENVLQGYKRTLRKGYDLHLAIGPEAGLKAVQEHGPFAVVVSDYAMPVMNGIEVLRRIKQLSPSTVRIMLTGYANMENAIAAINEGSIFRFLTKPCSTESLSRTLDDALEQYRLVMAEKELLEQTLFGSIRVMSQILSLVNPAAFSSTSRLKFYMKHLAVELGLEGHWRFELAAMLCQLGCVTIPQETLAKVVACQQLEPVEQEVFCKHPAVGAELIMNIPRLQAIARMIAGQNEDWGSAARELPEDMAVLGAQMLHVALDFDLMTQSHPIGTSIRLMRERGLAYHPLVLDAMSRIEHLERRMVIQSLKVSDIRISMVSDQEVRTRSGLLLMAVGQEVTKPILERLISFSRTVGVVEPIRMRVVQ